VDFISLGTTSSLSSLPWVCSLESGGMVYAQGKFCSMHCSRVRAYDIANLQSYSPKNHSL